MSAASMAAIRRPMSPTGRKAPRNRGMAWSVASLSRAATAGATEAASAGLSSASGLPGREAAIFSWTAGDKPARSPGESSLSGCQPSTASAAIPQMPGMSQRQTKKKLVRV